MKSDIIDRIDQALAENRQVKQQRMQAHVMWLLDNPTQMPIRADWDHETTEITERDLRWSTLIDSELWKFDAPQPRFHRCVRCLVDTVQGDFPWCVDTADCEDAHAFNIGVPNERGYLPSAGIDDLPQPLHRGQVHARPMVEGL